MNRGRVVHDKNERLKNILRRSYLARWVGINESVRESQPSSQETHLSLDSARFFLSDLDSLSTVLVVYLSSD